LDRVVYLIIGLAIKMKQKNWNLSASASLLEIELQSNRSGKENMRSGGRRCHFKSHSTELVQEIQWWGHQSRRWTTLWSPSHSWFWSPTWSGRSQSGNKHSLIVHQTRRSMDVSCSASSSTRQGQETLPRSTAWIDDCSRSTTWHLSTAQESSQRAFHLPNYNLWWEVGFFEVLTNKINGLILVKWWNLWPNERFSSKAMLCVQWNF
jgi:hypothetical protein